MSIRTRSIIYSYRTEKESIDYPPNIGYKKYVYICVFDTASHPRVPHTEILYLKKYINSCYDFYLVARDANTDGIKCNMFFAYISREISNVLISYRESSATIKL